MKTRPVEIEIEELVLYGLPARERQVIGDVLVQELRRLVAGGSLASRLEGSATWTHLDGGTIQLGSRPQGERAGRQVAGAVYATLLESTTGRRNR